MGTSKLCEFFDHMICCLELEEMMELWEKIALIKIFPADEPTDEIVMQPALYFPPNIEQRASLRKYTNKQKCHSFFSDSTKVSF